MNSKNKRVVIITAFFNYDYEIRIKFLETYFEKKGFETEIVSL